MTRFAAANNLAVVLAVPEHDCGPEICLGPDELDLPRFLELAGRLGGGVVYLRALPFDPDSDLDAPDTPPEGLISRRGQTGQISVVFAANGVMHFWEDCTAWYLEWEELADGQADAADPGGQDRLGEEERARLAGSFLADPQFRAASRGDRQRMARLALPPGTDQWVGWDAVRDACDRAQQQAEAAYGQLEPGSTTWPRNWWPASAGSRPARRRPAGRPPGGSSSRTRTGSARHR